MAVDQKCFFDLCPEMGQAESWFCSEDCKRAYWGENYFTGTTKSERFLAKLKQIRENKPAYLSEPEYNTEEILAYFDED